MNFRLSLFRDTSFSHCDLRRHESRRHRGDKFDAGGRTQLISPCGSERLDAACLAAFASGHLLPAAVNGTPVTSWASIPIAWNKADYVYISHAAPEVV
jgi:hypothetical protein